MKRHIASRIWTRRESQSTVACPQLVWAQRDDMNSTLPRSEGKFWCNITLHSTFICFPFICPQFVSDRCHLYQLNLNHIIWFFRQLTVLSQNPLHLLSRVSVPRVVFVILVVFVIEPVNAAFLTKTCTFFLWESSTNTGTTKTKRNYNINSIARACFIFFLSTLMTSAN